MSGLYGLGVAIAHMVVFSRADYDKYLSAVDGINCVSIPVLVISAEEDSFYGGKSPIYERQNEIINPNCSFVLMDEENYNGRYDPLQIQPICDSI